MTLAFSETVTVAGGVPTLTLNDGGTATYASGSGTSALTFTYTVLAGQNTPDLMVTAVNLPTGVTINDRFRQRGQPVAYQPDPERVADRHHNADHYCNRRIAGNRRSERGQHRHVDAHLQ